MRAAAIARVLGGARLSGEWWRCICPVHGSRTGRSATLALREGDRGGLVAHCHRGCDPREILAAMRRMGLTSDGNEALLPSSNSEGNGTGRRAALARAIWHTALDARATPVATYLASRGIAVPIPSVLRWASSLQRPDGTYGPAMVAAISGSEGTLIGVHRTWLCQNGNGVWQRRDRAMLGRAAGGAVRLIPVAETLLIGEGIENCLAGMQATALPAWAALSTAGLVALALPDIIRRIILLADHDVSGIGERAARTAAARWVGEGRCVKIAMPPETGSDFNDVLLGRGSVGARDVAA